MPTPKVPEQVKAYIDQQLKDPKDIEYKEIAKKVAVRFKVRVSKATISNRAKALQIKLPRGRKPVGKAEVKNPSRSTILTCAGAFFLKAAELETGLLTGVNQLFQPKADSIQARRILRLAQRINAFLLYAPLFNLDNSQQIARSHHRELLFLAGQERLPTEQEIEQYLAFLAEQKLLPIINKEVTKACSEAWAIRINYAGQTFYLDAQGRTVWSKPNIPGNFSTSLYNTKSYVKEFFQSPSAQRPLVLQTAPGYTFLPTEMFNLIHCLQEADQQEITQLDIISRQGATLASWQNLKPPGRCYFIFPLSPWQYVRLQGSQISRDFRQFRLGPNKEQMSIADAEVNLFNAQLAENIGVRAAMVRRKDEHLALITNIPLSQQRYIRRIAEQYFNRWPQPKIATYYDLLEQAHEEEAGYSESKQGITHSLPISYDHNPQAAFRLFLERLHRYALRRFFPSEYAQESWQSMRKQFYSQAGYRKIKQNCQEVFLYPFAQKSLQKVAKFACQKINQSDLKFPAQKALRIYLQGHK